MLEEGEKMSLQQMEKAELIHCLARARKHAAVHSVEEAAGGGGSIEGADFWSPWKAVCH